MAQLRASTIQQRGEEVLAALQYAACFHCLEKEWHDCEAFKPKPQENRSFVDRQVGAKSIARSGVRLQAKTVA